MKAFDSGDGDLFLFPWRVAVLLMPADARFGTSKNIGKNGQNATDAAVTYVARLGLEFSLHVYFLVAAIKVEEDARKEGKSREATRSHTQRRRTHLRDFLKSISTISSDSVAAQAVADNEEW